MITIIDYGLGNLGSIANMLKKIGAAAEITSDPQAIAAAEKLILPGVGAFDNGMSKLKEMHLLDVLNRKVLKEKAPIMGLCLGMQLFAQKSAEGSLPGLGWLDAEVVRFHFSPGTSALKVPHMGWNYIDIKQPVGAFKEMYPDPRFYFVHSYYMVCRQASDVLATVDYGVEFPAAVIHGNIMGMQFHPEKSHKYGMRLFTNFVEWQP